MSVKCGNIISSKSGDFELELSTDPNNSAVFGTDGLLYVPPFPTDSASVDFRWIYTGVSGEADPNANMFKVNNADPSLITEIYLSDLAYPNRNVGNILGEIREGDRIYLQQSSDGTRFINANVIGDVIDNTTYYTIPVEVFDFNDVFQINQFFNALIYHVANSGGGGGDPDPPVSSPKNPVFSYVNSLLTRVDYDNGLYKDLTYDTEGVLQQLDFFNGNTTLTKQFFYSPDGNLSSITET